jgi:UDP-N-acetylglucosamine 2-epimerase (non-hydrolysing)
MACTIVARKKGIKVAHLVAGTRSFDLNMPKEVNRMITDGLSDILFTASMTANRNLNQTGTEQANVHFVGNLLMDNLRHNLKRMTRPDEFVRLELGDQKFLLLTLNRHALLDDENKLASIMDTLLAHTDTPIVAPLHGYAKEKLTKWSKQSHRLYILEPQPYLSFGYLVSHSKAIVTDSGNVAEEATFLDIPCITLNTYAEHPETVTQGSNRLVGEDPHALAEALDTLREGRWQKGHLPERWDGRTAERIIQTLLENFS